MASTDSGQIRDQRPIASMNPFMYKYDTGRNEAIEALTKNNNVNNHNVNNHVLIVYVVFKCTGKAKMNVRYNSCDLE